MLELNGWFFVLLALFLSTYFILNRILFQPLLQVFKERRQAIEGSIEEAGKIQEKKDLKLDEFKRSMSEASQKARVEFETLREEGAQKQRELLEEAGKEAQGMIETARETIRAESEKARSALREDSEKYSDKIVDKLLRA
ncbi:MAG: ATP synthase F0 subunit B [Thermodesulfovibrionales bacterium]|nr:ATP synthase F0 subunit B [Thermodesulfovibrionales bacterium]